MLFYNKSRTGSQKSLKQALAIGAVIMLLAATNVHAQLTSMQSAFFQNQYLVNPAMAGLENQLNLNLDYRQQWINVPGAPRLATFTADYNSGNKVGLGLNIYNDQAGLIDRTRVMATYAYHIIISDKADFVTNEKPRLNFGLSLGLNDAYINYNDVVGDPSDPDLAQFNRQNLYVDGDLGVSYTSSKWNAQFSLPNLKKIFFKSAVEDINVEGSTFYSALSYRIQLSESFKNSVLHIEPKIAYRGVSGFNNIADIGFNFYRTTFENTSKLNLTIMYHTDNSFTTGVGYDINNFGVLFCYSANTGPLSTYANNTFELGINLRFKKKEL